MLSRAVSEGIRARDLAGEDALRGCQARGLSWLKKARKAPRALTEGDAGDVEYVASSAQHMLCPAAHP